MSARDEAVEMIRRICPAHLDRDQYGALLAEKFDAHQAAVLREAADDYEAREREQYPGAIYGAIRRIRAYKVGAYLRARADSTS